MNQAAVFTISLALGSLLMADEVRTTDGSVIQGTVTSLSAETLTIQTESAGSLRIPRTGVSGLSVSQAASVRLNDESVLTGSINPSASGNVNIGETEIALTRIKELWPQGAEDPKETARKAELAAKQRKWKTDLTAQASGKSGNTSQRNIAASLMSVLSGPKNELKMYGRYSQTRTEGTETANESVAGGQYSWYVLSPLGWYIRAEFEKDEYENLDLRSTAASGLSYRWSDTAIYKLSACAGLSYRYEQYTDAAKNDGFTGLDFGLSHFYRFKTRWEVKNDLTYTPSVENLKDCLITQDSYLALPVTAEWWKIKLGIRNDYNNRPQGDRDRLDSTWYAAISATKE
ncbi:MAG: DUF481 domain-containing protein [Pontiellaceae bacterium]|jgi:putative salt-induced outer membrane protein YdiY|nr:DUF481 domain-containing protein [Pontiellaceae bacterium]